MRFIIMLAAVSACGVAGGMHQATLVGQCAKDDAACAKRSALAPLAIGSHFYPEVSTDIPGSSTPNLRLESAEPGVLAGEDGPLVAKSEGTSAVLISTDDGSVVDFVHVWVSPVTHISLARRDGERINGPIGLAVIVSAPAQEVRMSGGDTPHAGAPGAPVVRLDLDKAIELALQNNNRSKVSRDAVEMALALHGQALSSWWPRIPAGIVVSRNRRHHA